MQTYLSTTKLRLHHQVTERHRSRGATAVEAWKDLFHSLQALQAKLKMPLKAGRYGINVSFLFNSDFFVWSPSALHSVLTLSSEVNGCSLPSNLRDRRHFILLWLKSDWNAIATSYQSVIDSWFISPRSLVAYDSIFSVITIKKSTSLELTSDNPFNMATTRNRLRF